MPRRTFPRDTIFFLEERRWFVIGVQVVALAVVVGMVMRLCLVQRYHTVPLFDLRQVVNL